jgi:lipopolysaccharide export system permease protein|tara:strand:- start:1941 stop:3032 length:1092 start_codon:yes stop_codon:yes gene_type:complete
MLYRLDRYLLKQFFSILGLCILGFVSIFLVVDLIENLDRFVDNGVPGRIILNYYLYSIPWFISIALPMSMLISTVFGVGMLVKRNEWTAMKSSGISLYRLSAPLLFTGLLISSLSFILDNQLVSWGNEKRYTIDRDYVKKKSRHKIKKTLKNIFIQKNKTIHIGMEKYNIKDMSGNVLTWVDLGPDIIKQRIDAKKITYLNDSRKWKISNYSIRNFKDGVETNVFFSEKDTIINLSFTPEDINKQARSPDELDYYELTSRISELKNNGVKTVRWEVTRYLKVSFALTNFIVVLCGIPLVVFREKNSLSFGIGMSVFVIFGYYAFIKFGQSMGFKGQLTPIVSAWLGNIVFFIGGAILLIRARK